MMRIKNKHIDNEIILLTKRKKIFYIKYDESYKKFRFKNVGYKKLYPSMVSVQRKSSEAADGTY